MNVVEKSHYSRPESLPPGLTMTSTWKGRTLAVLESIIAAIYTAFVQLAKICLSPWNHQHQVSNLTSDELSPEKEYQQASRCLHFFQVSLLQNTISVFKHVLILMAQTKYNIELEVEGKKLASQAIIQKVIDLLNEKDTFLKDEISSEDISQITAQIFHAVKVLEPFLKDIQMALPKRSEERKNFIRFRKTIVENYNKQIHIHQTPSSNEQLKIYQDKERQARQKFEAINCQISKF